MLHYTDCGIARLEDQPEMLSAYFEVEQNLLAAQTVSTLGQFSPSTSPPCAPGPAWRACAFAASSTTRLADSSTPS